MSDNDYYAFTEWEDIIEELDNYDGLLPGKAPDFINGLMERRPKTLSIAQVKWLEDLKRNFLQ